MRRCLTWKAELDPVAVDTLLRRFCADFPPVAVYQGTETVDDYLTGSTAGVPHREALLEELLFLWLANENPALTKYAELFDDAPLEQETAYRPAFTALDAFFATQPPFGPDNEPLLQLLQAPARRFPNSLAAQLGFIRERWSGLIGDFLFRLLGSLDLIAEEARVYIGVGGGPGKGEVPDFSAFSRPGGAGAFGAAGFGAGAPEPEPEQFSADLDWMPRLVLIAKNTYVWLDQLSRQYGREIRRLDEIPDEELDILARAGITGLWLIGLWERSEASKRIKHLCGNPDAVASAYSLDDYAIARGLGGDEAYDNLRQRAAARGVRMSSDMVPNHMGIDSRWVIEHPDWFISLPYSPYPTYAFNGPNLSPDPRVGIYLEDHYYSRSDAAVVFKRVDQASGETRYIYHGNDGTSMPWNDTAQLDFLKPEVREGVIQTILHVARKSSVIRFDAAMVLAKRHIQRLWYPEPGSGGGVPSRSEFGLTKAQFDQAMPLEFWREVVDRVAAEVPDTLLLAEAFWLMEGYFVRTLGMHRVYNSAFMHMMRDEDNANYRLAMKNTLEFNPEILKRYVNFMNNPDEETAVEQFGKGDKYFGVATLLATLPGLPMIGHGQIEGYAEKYGMEYQRAYYNETPDQYLVERHQLEIFPLFHRRYLFAEVTDFLLYDFRRADNQVDENVFAFSNRRGSERALVIYHNRWASTAGWVRMSVGFSIPAGPETEERVLVQRSLADGLSLSTAPDHYLIFRDHVTNLEYIRASRTLAEEGLFVELGGYKCHVFLDFRDVVDDATGRYARLTAYLNGRGVPSVHEALQELLLEPLLTPYSALVNGETLRTIVAARTLPLEEQSDLLDDVTALLLAFHSAAQTEAETPDEARAEDVANALILGLTELLQLSGLAGDEMLSFLPPGLVTADTEEDRPPVTAAWGTTLLWLFTHRLGQVAGVPEEDAVARSRSWLDDWLLGRIGGDALRALGLDEGAAARAVLLVKLLTTHQSWLATPNLAPDTLLPLLLRDPDVRRYLQINRYDDVLWFNKESFTELRQWLALAAVQDVTLQATVDDDEDEDDDAADSAGAADSSAADSSAADSGDERPLDLLWGLAVLQTLADAGEASAYQVEKLISAASGVIVADAAAAGDEEE